MSRLFGGFMYVRASFGSSPPAQAVRQAQQKYLLTRPSDETFLLAKRIEAARRLPKPKGKLRAMI